MTDKNIEKIIIDESKENEYYSPLEKKEETAAKLAKGIFIGFAIFIFIVDNLLKYLFDLLYGF